VERLPFTLDNAERPVTLANERCSYSPYRFSTAPRGTDVATQFGQHRRSLGWTNASSRVAFAGWSVGLAVPQIKPVITVETPLLRVSANETRLHPGWKSSLESALERMFGLHTDLAALRRSDSSHDRYRRSRESRASRGSPDLRKDATS